MQQPSLLKTLSRLMLTGLFTVLPVVVTLAILVWLASILESVLGGVLAWILPEGLYVTGMGFLAGLVLVFVVGVIMSTWLAQRVFGHFETVFLRVPFLNSVYGAVKDITLMFSPNKHRQFGAVVAFRLPGTDAQLLGFTTRTDTTDLPAPINDAETVAVYLPMSYQIGGYMLLLPRDQLTEVDMSVHDALRFVLTAGVSRGT